MHLQHIVCLHHINGDDTDTYVHVPVFFWDFFEEL